MSVTVVEGGDAAAKLLTGAAPERFDAVILDLVMPDLDGLGVLARLREAGLTIPVIVQTAHGGIDNVVSAMRAGAADFVVKPVGAERLQVSLRNALAASALEGEFTRLKRSQSGTLTFKDIITRSPSMQAVLRTAEKAAASAIPVLIEGESGVGKEMIARAIHGSGERRAKPFVAVNCGAIPDNLVESLLFGHEKGAFTGATERHVGKFVEASGGTLFLDEIGELPPAAQVKLLRAIQEGEVEPVGARKAGQGRRAAHVGHQPQPHGGRDKRAGSAKTCSTACMCFRSRCRRCASAPEDIPDLARHFLARFGAEEGKRIRQISPAALGLLAAYRWPGNVRQLENAVFRAVVLADRDNLGTAEFPQIAAQLSGDSEPAPALAAEMPSAEEPAAERPNVVLEPAVAPPAPGALALLDSNGDVRALDDLEAEVIRFAITHYRGQMSEVARRLRIGRSTLYRKLDALGVGAHASAESTSGPVAAG